MSGGHTRALPAGVEVATLPSPESGPNRLGPGEFVVAGFARGRFPELLERMDDVRVVQAISAGVDDLVGRLPESVILCDGAGIHDVPVGDGDSRIDSKSAPVRVRSAARPLAAAR